MPLIKLLHKWFWTCVLRVLELVGAGQKSPGLGVVIIFAGLGLIGYWGYTKVVDYFKPPQTSAGQYVPPSPPPQGPGPVAVPQTSPPVTLPPVTTYRRQSPAIQATPLPDFAGIKPPAPLPPRLPDPPEGVIRGYRPPLPSSPYRPD